MAQRDYYLITALPHLGELGDAAPLTGRRLVDQTDPTGPAGRAIAAVLLSDDLLQREAALVSADEKFDPAVLTAGQLSGDEALPDVLAPPQSSRAGRRIAGDAVWEAYFRHAASVAEETGNGFLAAWVGYEVSLRNALAARRAKTLELEPDDYLVATDLAETGPDFSTVINSWAAAVNPLEGMRVLDRTRWQWLLENDKWYSFDNDELTAYAAKLLLLQRWQRMAEQERNGSAAEAQAVE